jgi:hypothetical protein
MSGMTDMTVDRGRDYVRLSTDKDKDGVYFHKKKRLVLPFETEALRADAARALSDIGWTVTEENRPGHCPRLVVT